MAPFSFHLTTLYLNFFLQNKVGGGKGGKWLFLRLEGYPFLSFYLTLSGKQINYRICIHLTLNSRQEDKIYKKNDFIHK